MDADQIVDEITSYLGLTGVVDKALARDVYDDIVAIILGYADWTFLDDEVDDLSISSATDIYDTPTDFIYPLVGTVRCESDGLNITIVSPEWLATYYPDPSNIDGLKYCLFLGQKIRFYRVSDLDSSKTIKYWYHKTGSAEDLSFDAGFEKIVKDGMIGSLAKGGTPIQVDGQGKFLLNLEKKANLYKRQYGGEIRFVPSDPVKTLEAIRQNLRW